MDGARNALLRADMDKSRRIEEMQWAQFCLEQAIYWAYQGDGEPPRAETLTGRAREGSQ